jgi:hypothetical protein
MKGPPSRLEEGSASAASSESGTPAAPALDLDVLMARLREEVQARKREAAPAAAHEPKCVRAADLLDLPEAAFVMKAYRALLGREADPEEADRAIDRLLLGRVKRTELLVELLATEEARAAGATLEGLPQARVRERLMASPVASLGLSAANALRTVYLLPKRVHQFVKRVEALEQRASEQARRIESLERDVLSLRTAHHAQSANSPDEPQPAPQPAALSAGRRSDGR